MITSDNNASPQGREELRQEVGAPYCFTGCEHRQVEGLCKSGSATLEMRERYVQ